MKRIKALILCLLAGCLLGTAARAGRVILNTADLSNLKVYTLHTTNRGYLTLNTAQTTLVSSHTGNGGTVNSAAATDDASRQFGMMKLGGLYYLYSPKLKKFASWHWPHGETQLFFTDNADFATPFELTTDGTGGDGGSTFRFRMAGYRLNSSRQYLYLNNNNGGKLLLNNYSTVDAGNVVTIEEVDGVVLNEIEAIKIFNDTSLDPTKTYDLKYKNEVGDRTVSAYLLGNTSSIGARTSTNNNTKWAFVRVGGKRYMYNVEQKKFVTTTGSLDADPSKAGNIGIVASGDGTYGYHFYIIDTGKYFDGRTDYSWLTGNTCSFSIVDYVTSIGDPYRYAPQSNDTDKFSEMIDKIGVNSLSQFVNSKVYYIRCKRGSLILNKDTGSGQYMLMSSAKDGGTTINADAATDDASRQFGVVQFGGCFYLYSPKLKKFGAFHTDNKVYFNESIEYATPMAFTSDGTDGIDGSTLRLRIAGFGGTNYREFYINNNNGGNIMLNNYRTADTGNTWRFEEVPDITLDVNELAAIFTTSDFLSPHKVYTISCERQGRFLQAVGTNIKASTTATTDNERWAFIKYNGKRYMFNVGQRKFVATDATLTATKANMSNIGVHNPSYPAFPLYFFTTENGIIFNTQTMDPADQNPGDISFNQWNGFDIGNRYAATEVEGMDAFDDMIAILGGEGFMCNVVYDLYFHDGSSTYIRSESIGNQRWGSPIATAPSSLENEMVTLVYDNTLTVDDVEKHVTVNAIWGGPFQPSTESRTYWYNLKIGGLGRYVGYESMREPYHPHAFDDTSAERGQAVSTSTRVVNPETELYASPLVRASRAYQWAFYGNPYNGFRVVNRERGNAYSLTVDGTARPAYNLVSGNMNEVSNTVLREGNFYWDIHRNTSNGHENGFVLNLIGQTNLYINPNGSADGFFQTWQSAGARADSNSQILVEEAPNFWEEGMPNTASVALNSAGDGNYATLCVPFDISVSGAEAYTIGDIDKASIYLTPAEGTIPAGTPLLLMSTGSQATVTMEGNYRLTPLTAMFLTGTFLPLNVNGATDYFLGKHNGKAGFYHWTGTTLRENRAYLPAANVSGGGGAVKGFAFWNDDIDGMESVEADEGGCHKTFDLMGRPVSTNLTVGTPKGIYIRNGRKFIVK